MERIERPAFTFVIRTYCMLTKPGIVMGNAITAAGGFALVSRGHIAFSLFFTTLVGLSLIIASACVFNNYIDRKPDGKMNRTKNRPLVKQLVTVRSAIIFAIILGLYGTSLLAFFVNPLTASIALFGFCVYVMLYSFIKQYSIHATLIGSIAGAVPPVVGYCAVSNRIDLGAFILFMMIAMWQMPHFFAIAMYRLEDYAAASIPVFPIIKGSKRTKIVMLLYIIGFIAASFMLTLFNYVEYSYCIVTTLLSFIWLYLCIKGFKCSNDKPWARKMFFFSLLIVIASCAMIPFTVI